MSRHEANKIAAEILRRTLEAKYQEYDRTKVQTAHPRIRNDVVMVRDAMHELIQALEWKV